jgi:hypothetical protein
MEHRRLGFHGLLNYSTPPAFSLNQTLTNSRCIDRNLEAQRLSVAGE